MSGIDVIITTYNRPTEVTELARQLNECEPSPSNIIVVDSSDDYNTSLAEIRNVTYVRSTHKNQPYQRHLGATISDKKFLLFLDDDLKVLNFNLFKYLLQPFTDEEVVGSTVNFEYHNSITDKLAKSTKKISILKKNYTPGRIYISGHTGPKPLSRAEVEFFPGPVMCFRKDVFLKLISDELLALFEKKLAMGEDKIISMRANMYGKLIFDPEICFIHPPNESTYFNNLQDFQRKVVYSRLYIAMEFARVFKVNRLVPYLYFYATQFVKISVLSAIYLKDRTIPNGETVKGVWQGILQTVKLPYRSQLIAPGIDWQIEIQKDVARYLRSDQQTIG